MKNLIRTLLNLLPGSSKESKLVSKFKPSEVYAAAKDKVKEVVEKPAEDILKTRLFGDKDFTESWDKAENGTVGKWNEIGKDPAHTDSFKGTLKGLIGGMEKEYNKIIAGGIDEAEMENFLKKLEDTQKTIEIAKKLDLKKDKLKEQVKPDSNVVKELLPEGEFGPGNEKYEKQAREVIAKSLEEERVKLFSNIEKTEKALGVNSPNLAEIDQMIDEIPENMTDYLISPLGAKANAQQVEYVYSVKFFIEKGKVIEDKLGAPTSGSEYEKALEELKSKAIPQVTDQKKVIEEFRQAESKILAAYVYDHIKDQWDDPELPPLTPELLEKILDNYATGDFNSDPNKRKQVDKVLQLIKADPDLASKIRMNFEGKADSTKFKKISIKRISEYRGMVEVAKRMLDTELKKSPEVISSRTKIDEFIAKSNELDDVFIKYLKANQGTFIGPDGVFNLILAYRRLENFAGGQANLNNTDVILSLRTETQSSREASVYFTLVDSPLPTGSVPAQGTAPVTTPVTTPSAAAGLRGAQAAAQAVPTPSPVPSPSPIPTTPTLKPEKPQTGETKEFMGTIYTEENGKYKIEGMDRTFDWEEMKIMLRMEVPTEAYMKEKTTVDYLNGEPKNLKYNRVMDEITAEYIKGTDTIKVTYDMMTDKKQIDLTSGTLKPLVDPNADKLTVIEGALRDGLSEADIASLHDPNASSELEKDLTSGNLPKALERLSNESTLNTPLIAEVLHELIANGQLTNVHSDVFPRLKPKLDAIIQNYSDTIGEETLEMFKNINGGTLSEAQIKTLLEQKECANDFITYLIKSPIYRKFSSVANAYLTSPVFDSTLIQENTEAVDVYTGNIMDLPEEAIDLITDTAKLTEYLEKSDPYDLPANYKDIFENVYNTPPLTGASKINPEVLAKYYEASSITDLEKTNADTIFTIGSPEAVKFVDTWLSMYQNMNFTPTDDDHTNRYLDILKKCTSPEAIILTQQIVDAESITEDPAEKVKRADEIYKIALDENAKPEDRITALNALLEGEFKDVTPTVAQSLALNEYKEILKTHLAATYYKEMMFTEITDELKETLDANKSLFIDTYKDAISSPPGTVDDFNFDTLRDSVNDIGAEALYELAEITDSNGDYILTDSQRFRIFAAIGLKGEAEMLLGNITNNAEKLMLESMLITDKTEKFKKLKKAYDEIDILTSNEVILEISKNLLYIIDDVTITDNDRDKVLNALETKHLGTLANKMPAQIQNIINSLTRGIPLPLTPEQEKESGEILEARLLQVEVEIRKYEAAQTNVLTGPDAQALIDEIYNCLGANKLIDANYEFQSQIHLIDKMKELIDVSALPPAYQEKYSVILVTVAMETEDDSYLDGIKVEYLGAQGKNDKLKAYLHEKKDEFLEAAKLISDEQKKFDLLNQVDPTGKEQEVAEEYEDLSTAQDPEIKKDSQKKAVEIYISGGQFSEARGILENPQKIDDGDAKALLDQMVAANQGNVAIEIALDRPMGDYALELFEKNKDIVLEIDMINDAILNSLWNPEKVINILAKEERTGKVNEVGSNTKRQAFYTANNTYIANPNNFSDSERAFIEKNLEI